MDMQAESNYFMCYSEDMAMNNTMCRWDLPSWLHYLAGPMQIFY